MLFFQKPPRLHPMCPFIWLANFQFLEQNYYYKYSTFLNSTSHTNKLLNLRGEYSKARVIDHYYQVSPLGVVGKR